MAYKFKFEEKEYTLDNENLGGFFNDEINPIEGLDESGILNLLEDGRDINFSKAFYSLACEECKEENAEKQNAYDFLEFHFYIYTKDGKIFTSTISKDYADWDYERLLSIKKIDNSYIATVIVCKNCGVFDIEIEELEM